MLIVTAIGILLCILCSGLWRLIRGACCGRGNQMQWVVLLSWDLSTSLRNSPSQDHPGCMRLHYLKWLHKNRNKLGCCKYVHINNYIEVYLCFRKALYNYVILRNTKRQHFSQSSGTRYCLARAVWPANICPCQNWGVRAVVTGRKHEGKGRNPG